MAPDLAIGQVWVDGLVGSPHLGSRRSASLQDRMDRLGEVHVGEQRQIPTGVPG